MDYIRIYKQIIENARNLESQRLVDKTYVEEHHIVPKCMGGLDVDSNLVYLTAREHFICHWLLFKKYKSADLAHAFYSMVNGPLAQNSKRDIQPSSYVFSAAREAQAWANGIQGNRRWGKIPHEDPASFELPEEWKPLRICPKLKGTVNLLNLTTGHINRYSCEEAKKLIAAGNWKYPSKDKRKLYRKSHPEDVVMVTIDSPLLAERDWEFSSMNDTTLVCYVVENDQHYRWLVKNVADIPAGYKQISDRYTNVKTRKIENRYIAESQDITKYISTSTPWVSKTNVKTGETRKVYICEPEYTDPDWQMMKPNAGKIACIDQNGNRKLVNPNNIPEGWTISEKRNMVICVNAQGIRKLFDLDKPINTNEWSLVSDDIQTLRKVKKFGSRYNLGLLKDKEVVMDYRQGPLQKGCVKKNIITGETRFMLQSDPLYNDPNWKGAKTGQINLRNLKTGEIRCVPVNDPLRQDPDWVTLTTRRSAYRNVETGETKLLSKDDPEFLTGKWVSTSKGWSTYRNIETGEKASFGKDDPRYGDPKWESIYKHCNDHVPDITCPYCGKVCRKGKGYKRWHGENCKHKPKTPQDS